MSQFHVAKWPWYSPPNLPTLKFMAMPGLRIVGALFSTLALFFAPPCFSSTETPVLEKLEQTLGRRLSREEFNFLAEQLPSVTQSSELIASANKDAPASGSTILFCARAEAQLYLGSSLAACVDLALRAYYLISAGAGFGAGITLSAFSLIYRSRSGMPVEGTYYGAKLGGAFGHLGGSVGVYFRGGGNTKTNDINSDRLYWIGYNVGASFDLSTAMINIGRI